MFKKILNKLSASNNSEEIFACATGELIRMEDVPDPIFSQKMLGEGIAILPVDGKIVAPADGEIVMIAVSKHAFAIRTEMGEEILVHIGLETVELNGEGFNFLVDSGAKVIKGQPIVEIDLKLIEAKASSTIIPMVVTNSLDGRFVFEWGNVKEVKAGETKVFTTNLK